MQFKVDEATNNTGSLAFRGQAIDNAPAFSSTAKISTRTLTSATVNWVPPAWVAAGDAGAVQQTPDLAAVIQEIVNRSGWSSGNALAIVVTGSGRRTAVAYEASSSGAALLHVEFAGGSPAP